MLELLVKVYILLAFYHRKFTGKNLRGRGYIQRKFLKKDFSFKVKGKSFFYDHTIEGSYDMLLIGKSNEPETLLFFERVMPKLNVFNFIDVGASIGEMVIEATRYNNLLKAYAFEPRKACCNAIIKALEMDRESRCTIKNYAVCDKSNETIKIYNNPGGTASGIFSSSITIPN